MSVVQTACSDLQKILPGFLMELSRLTLVSFPIAFHPIAFIAAMKHLKLQIYEGRVFATVKHGKEQVEWDSS